MIEPPKKTIVYKLNNPGIPNHGFWRERLAAWFKFEEFDDTKTYNKIDHVMWMCYLEKDKSWVDPFLQQGFKVIHDYLWDHHGTATVEDDILILKSDHWTVADFSLRAKKRQYPVNSNPDKLFLCKIRKASPDRDVFFDRFKQYQNRALMSYVFKGIELPDDVSQTHPNFRWYQNPDWFDSTCFSLVTETSLTDFKFISEKTFTPFAFKHPLIVYGPPRILNLVEVLGFKTYPHIVDEYYDSIDDIPTRLKLIEDEVAKLDRAFSRGIKLFTDPLSMEIKDHNHNLIYGDDLTTKIVWMEIAHPILRYIDA